MTSSAAIPPLPLEHCRFAVVDVETTGTKAPPAGGGRILEVAVAILEGGTVHLAFHALLDPGISITPWVTRLTGITDALVAGRQRFADVVCDLGRTLEGAVFVAHNARFDWGFLAAECAAVGVAGPGGKPVCTVRLTRRLVPELRHRSLDDLASFFSVANPARHRAFGDALATAYILRSLLWRARERGVETLEELRELHDRPRHRLRMSDFGLRIGRPPVESAIRNPQSAIPS